MLKNSLPSYLTLLNTPRPSLCTLIQQGVAVALFGIIFPLLAKCEDGPRTASPAADTPQCEHGCCFAPSIRLGREKLELRGLSTFRYWGFRVYTGALYAPPAAKTRDAVRGESRKKLVLCYHRSLSPDQFREKSLGVLEDTPGLDLATLEPQLSAINNAYVGVKEGDRYSISYEPSSGTMTLLLNEKEPALITIQSPPIAKAYFGIWLSEYSVDKELTRELFGERDAQ